MRFTKEQIVAASAEAGKKYADLELELLKKFAEIDCGSRNEEGNRKVVEIIDEELKKIEGIDIKHLYYPGYGINIVAKLTPENPEGKIILNAHTDTVFKPGDVEKYPWRIEGDTLYGLGVIDCKGGILTAIHSVKAMQEAGMLPNKEIVFIFNCDEEIGSPTGHQVFDMEIPGTEMAFVFEPSRLENGVLTARKGACTITIDVKGKEAHSGINYLDGRSAVTELAYRILKLYESNIDERGIQFNVGPVENKFSTGVVSGRAKATVGVRVANSADIETVKQIVAERNKDKPYIEGTETTITIDRIGVPMERTEENYKVYQIVKNAGEILGMDLPEQATGGGGDASYLNYNGVPTVDALGPYMYQIHSPDESMRISSIEEKLRLFSAVLATL